MNFEQHSSPEKSAFQHVKDEALLAANAVADEASAQSSEAKENLEQKKEAGANQFKAIEHALESAAQDLKDNDYNQLSSYVTQFAQSLGSVADNLRNKNIDEVFHSIQSVAKRNPTLFIAGSIALGLGISRFMKASSHRERHSSHSASELHDSRHFSSDQTERQNSSFNHRTQQSKSQDAHQPPHALSSQSLEENHSRHKDFSEDSSSKTTLLSSQSTQLPLHKTSKKNSESQFTGQGFMSGATEEDYAADDFLGASHPHIEDDDWWRDSPDAVGKPRPVSQPNDGDRHYE